ncbi:MAG TPA: ABC transporter permease [Thermoanaerobaculia bacterium]|nr:ABC transporter permease [Thermoanaerobaculia bacterium]
MTLNEAVEGALSNLAKHKLRTALTMLGMVFGVGAVIAMLSIGAGAEKSALEAIDRLGVHNVIIRSSAVKPEDLPAVRKKSLGVSLRDAEAIQEAIPHVTGVLPRIEIKSYKVIAAGARTKAKVFGVSWRQPQSTSIPLSEGRFFEEDEEIWHAQVCVIGESVRRDLFGFSEALGKDVKVNDVWLQVIGVLEAQEGSSGKNGVLQDVPLTSSSRQIFVPITTAMRKFERDPLESPIDELQVEIAPAVSTSVAASMIRPLLDRLHAGAEDYELVVPETLLEQSRKTQRIFNIVMGSIAGISLLVGGIGIMNIMLASVLERTREIGLRRALGARQQDIRTQFMIESFSISFIGGAAGIIIGVVLAQIVAAFAGWPTVVSVWSIILSTGVSVSVGWASGIYPATRAAALDPIEALRYE